MTTMTNDLLCEKCNDYGWNMVDGVWVNGGIVEKNFCNNMCANHYQIGAEG